MPKVSLKSNFMALVFVFLLLLRHIRVNLFCKTIDDCLIIYDNALQCFYSKVNLIAPISLQILSQFWQVDGAARLF